MLYPDWVNKPKTQSPKELAKKRLRYILLNAALHIGDRASYYPFAKLTGMHHTTFCMAVERGNFSLGTALIIESHVGRHLAPHEVLVNPLIEEWPEFKPTKGRKTRTIEPSGLSTKAAPAGKKGGTQGAA
jgi:hypothetical protein